MVWYRKRKVLEDLSIVGGLVGMQFVYAGNSIFLSYLMSLGFNPSTIVIFTTFATFLVISPIAVCCERKKWPKQLTLKLVIQLLLMSFAGVTLFQSLFLMGIKLTSPALATAMPNLAPGLIFIIAWTMRLEKVKLRCIYSKVKIVGTSLCVVGALTMSLMHSAKTAKEAVPLVSSQPDNVIFDKQKIIGCLYLMAAVIILSGNVVLQAVTLGDFPAPMSLCSITSLLGVIITAIVQLCQDHKFEIGWPMIRTTDLIGFSLLGGAIGGACLSFNGWAIKKKGPVLVSMFSPIGTVISVVLSVFTLGDAINVGSIAGMFLMFTGLYFVLWAKGKESYLDGDALESEFDPKKPLLS